MTQAKGFVCLIDILGFKNLVRDTERLVKVLTEWEKLLSSDSSDGIRYVMFSDTVIIYILGNSQNDFQKIARKTSALFYRALASSIAIRGCISMGTIVELETTNGRIIAGDAIVDAHNYEGKQNWLGIMVSPTLLANYYGMSFIINQYKSVHADMFPREIVFEENIPLYAEDKKAHTGYAGFCIFPRAADGETTNSQDFEKFISALEIEMIKAPDVAAQKKYQLTIHFIARQFSYQIKKVFKK